MNQVGFLYEWPVRSLRLLLRPAAVSGKQNFSVTSPLAPSSSLLATPDDARMTGEDVEGVGAQLEQLSISNGADQETPMTVPRANFPLPRELRDQIYGYLLHHEYVHEAPYHTRDATTRHKVSDPHTYNSSLVEN